MLEIPQLVKRYGSIITINTDNIKQNYYTLQKYVYPAIMAPVLKSDAYGISLPHIVGILDELKCENYFVATLEEGINARTYSKSSNIYILHGIFGDSCDLFTEYNLIPVINSLDQLNIWLKFAITKNQKLRCIIHIDSGINRLGLQKEEVNYLIHNYKKITKNLEIIYIMSHLACSDNKDATANQAQYQVFKELTSHFPEVKKSLAASYGIYLDKKFHFDLVRPGFALYGSNPTPFSSNTLLPVVEFYSSVIKVNSIKKGEKVGYTHAWEAKRDSKLATVTVGYADGLIRGFASKMRLYINNTPVPIVGVISMDSLVVDITDLDTPVIEGTVVEIIGPNQDIDQFAKMNSTINCEAFNILGKRYPRIYY